jgi:excisionase family DNA binding protein
VRWLRCRPLDGRDGEVADLVRIAVSTVYELARRGRIRAHGIGRTWRFARREIEEWLLAS